MPEPSSPPPTTVDDASMAALLAARSLLCEVTPLQGDCGRFCGAACCGADAGEENGMYLFPGEDALYPASTTGWARIVRTRWQPGGAAISLLVCGGQCARDARPLACRIFPLIGRCNGQGVRIQLDVRAWPVCPLMPHGIQGLSGAFVAAVRAAFALLWAEPAHRAFIKALDGVLCEYEAL